MKRLRAENEDLKNELARERRKLEFLETQIEHENKPLDYDPKLNVESFGANPVRQVLHEELLRFDAEISKITEAQKDTIKAIETVISKCVHDISTDIEVILWLNRGDQVWVICHQVEHALE